MINQQEIARCEQQKDCGIEELLEPDDALDRQLLDLIAEQSALDDTEAYLEDCLKEKTLNVDEYLAEVRDNAKRQFYAKQLKTKVIRAIRARKVQQSSSAAGAGGVN